jgi:hypothetical protein
VKKSIERKKPIELSRGDRVNRNKDLAARKPSLKRTTNCKFINFNEEGVDTAHLGPAVYAN